MARKYSQTSEKNFLLIIGILFIIITLYLIKDIYILIIYSLILSYFLFPLYNFYLKKIKNARISSLITISSATLLFFLPLALLSYFLILSLIRLILEYKIYIQNPEILNNVMASFIEKLTNSQILSSINYSDYLNNIVLFAVNISKNFFNSIPKTIMGFAVILFITYYILVYNKEMLLAINNYLPLGLKRQNEILKNVTKNLKVLFKGYFLTGIIQTLVALIGYILFGVNNLLIITTLTLFSSLIPYLGTPLVWIPASLYLMITGHEVSGIGLLLYGTLVISIVDNFLRPVLMSNKDTISPPLVFIGFLGGMLAFGISGIILGPIIISITSILLRYIKEHYELKDI